ncbi:MAG: class I SAM-dependent rRNA methyltransferase [Tenuifilum sp.]|uniref:class I SAM-dependent rRNA methyltransferase n=1 Tax=Tenuifilum sp. TaxID=2760880 RepID=UPI001B6CF8B8|nr:class I SAM-dependent rRNA methyltransferase [Bacteroidales bacterium]HRR11750.1 class I SAM-dependent rRNA methyltransferase [Tenuifilum sp.]HRS44211.1 class I SAM-dependent rRNA methyltransferase [Tenuifilum sp.]HRU85712.1 class I SAM-dependent rRNA methyltransferase [Tenuifilum sp.]
MERPRITLKPGKEQSLLRFHPWIFSGAIKSVTEMPNEGQVVDVLGSDGKFLATGHFASGSIAVRVLSFQPVEVDRTFWLSRISNALNLRRAIGLYPNTDTNIFRLVHGESDLLPGLIVDIYGDTAVMQCHSVGMYLARTEIANEIMQVLPNTVTAVYDKSSGTLPYREKYNPSDGYIVGSENVKLPYLEYGNKYHISWADGQKTGFFIDQRENRLLLQSYARGKSVLNTFGYTGGFSVSALKGGATEVITVDSSAQAITLANQNIELNFGDNAPHTGVAMDTFEYLRTCNRNFDIIVLDPPAFAKHNDALRNALQAYKRLNLAAIRRLNPGGLLFTFSCSQVVSKTDFRNAVFSAAAISGRQVCIIHQLTQPADHPINIYHPEGEYLKGLVLSVM